MEEYSDVIVGLSYDEVALIKTCIQFTKSWAKCFDNEKSKEKCNELIHYLNEVVEYEKR